MEKETKPLTMEAKKQLDKLLERDIDLAINAFDTNHAKRKEATEARIIKAYGADKKSQKIALLKKQITKIEEELADDGFSTVYSTDRVYISNDNDFDDLKVWQIVRDERLQEFNDLRRDLKLKLFANSTSGTELFIFLAESLKKLTI